MHAVAPSQSDLWPDASPPELVGRPTELAYWHGSLLSRSRSREEQRALGQFITPAPIARLMAERLVAGRAWAGREVRLLDPAAGSGVLAAALVEAALASDARPARIELLLCELDASMLPLLQQCARELGLSCTRHGVEFDCHVQGGDFLMSPLAQSGQACVDAVIANPPYFKLAGRDARAQAFAHAVHGQPNIYALFMASCASLLRPGGGLCFITPRSWTNGAYFRALRKHLLGLTAIDGLHLFDSREAHFRADAVLQEALITWASAGRPQAGVDASSSEGGGDLHSSQPVRWPAWNVIGPAPQHMISIPGRHAEHDLADLPLRLRDLGLRVSTGPVVGFRAAMHLRSQAGPATVPMLWMPHVRSMRIEWPRGHRAEHIDANDASAWMLLPNQPMVLIRRFSPKEDARRVTAAPYLGDLPGELVGLENHLNAIHPVAGSLSREAVQGLAAYLNSLPVDRYLRRLLGSTQVNAVELRELPVPGLQTLEAIARALPGAASLDDAVATICRFGASVHAASHG